MSQPERSVSRGREFTSSGRGGWGNIRASSASRDRPIDGPDDFSDTRGRELAVDSSRIYSTGRGGAGNFRSPSRDGHIRLNDSNKDHEVVQQHALADENAPHSFGRGGLGNFSRSRSRGPGTPPRVHSTGRGGAGNIVSGPTPDLEEPHHSAGGELHSTGRGGLANVTAISSPGVEHHEPSHPEIFSSGRGGAGNIYRDRSASREPGKRADSKDRHGLAGLVHRIKHPHGSSTPDKES